MKKILENFKKNRHEFEHGHLEGFDGDNPYELFELWMTESVENEENEPNAFVLSTVDSDHQPSSRIVYLKDIIEKQFVFYTNYNSKKGKDIATNDKVSMLFFWPNSSRQVRIQGKCTKVAPEVSDAYFNLRPRGNRLGAWASDQSDELVHRTDLEKKFMDLNNQFDEEIPRPDHWGGYQVEPTYFEFWQGRPSRLHDRVVFERVDNAWKIKRLNP